MKTRILAIMVIVDTVISILIILTSVNYNQPVFIGMINIIQGYEPNFSDEELLQKLSKFNEVNSFLEMYPDTNPIITINEAINKLLFPIN